MVLDAPIGAIPTRTIDARGWAPIRDGRGARLAIGRRVFEIRTRHVAHAHHTDDGHGSSHTDARTLAMVRMRWRDRVRDLARCRSTTAIRVVRRSSWRSRASRAPPTTRSARSSSIPAGRADPASNSCATAASRSLRDSFDLVSWDPRGVGGSEALDCATDTTLLHPRSGPRRLRPRRLRSRTPHGPSPTRASDADPSLLADAHHDPRRPETSSSFDARSVMEQLNYFGFSYGTHIGLDYAALFPEHIRTMVLDGVVDPGESLTAVPHRTGRGDRAGAGRRPRPIPRTGGAGRAGTHPSEQRTRGRPGRARRRRGRVDLRPGRSRNAYGAPCRTVWTATAPRSTGWPTPISTGHPLPAISACCAPTAPIPESGEPWWQFIDQITAARSGLRGRCRQRAPALRLLAGATRPTHPARPNGRSPSRPSCSSPRRVTPPRPSRTPSESTRSVAQLRAARRER